jgi:hypothetical protein
MAVAAPASVVAWLHSLLFSLWPMSWVPLPALMPPLFLQLPASFAVDSGSKKATGMDDAQAKLSWFQLALWSCLIALLIDLLFF